MAHHVLIVDDDRSIAELAALWLGAAGFEVDTAFDGVAGLHAARTRHPDVVLLDVRMPLMDGFEVAGELRRDALLARTPVIFLSANVGEPTRRRAHDAGARAFLNKPFDSGALIAAVREAISGTPRGAPVGEAVQ